jgi:hypothetical protein
MTSYGPVKAKKTDMSYNELEELLPQEKEHYKRKLDSVGMAVCPYKLPESSFTDNSKEWPALKYVNHTPKLYENDVILPCQGKKTDMSYNELEELLPQEKEHYKRKLDSLGMAVCPYKLPESYFTDNIKEWPALKYVNHTPKCTEMTSY